MTMRFMVFALAALSWAAHAHEGYYQQPSTDGRQLVFSSEGDLWLAPLSGGTAQRLTRHAELETDPVLSADGEWIAFLGQYDEEQEIYVMPVNGGAPKRLTFNGRVFGLEGWTADGRVLYASAERPGRQLTLRDIDPDTLEERQYPVLAANQGAFTEEGRLFFTRFGLHLTGDHAKHYRGGAMAQIWTYRDGEQEASRWLADVDANVRRPMWTRGRLYFLSDLEGAFDIWSVNGDGEDLTRHTRHSGWDVRHAEARGNVIVYQLGADLYRLDLETDRSERIEIDLRTDFDPRRERWLPAPLDFASSYHLAPTGDRLAVTARGRVTLFGLPGDRRIEVALPMDLRGRNAVIGAQGEWVYAISPVGEYDEIVRYPARGGGDGEPLTRDGSGHRWRMAPSPDGRFLAHDDHRGNLWLLDLKSGMNARIDQQRAGDEVYSDLTWSSDGRLLAYTRFSASSRVNQVVLHDTDDGRTERLTSDRFPAYAPAFSADRAFLYFLSDRHYVATPGSPWGDRNLGPMFDRRGKLYALALNADARFPFLPKGLAAAPVEPDAEASQSKEDDADAPEPARLDWNGLADRLYETPVPPGNYARLRASEKFLFLLDTPNGGDAQLKSIEISDTGKMETFAEKVADYDLSADGKKLFYRIDKAAYIVDTAAKAPPDLASSTINLADWKLAITPEAEWRQMFDDAWRMHRDFAFDPNLRGVDWAAVRDKYRPLLDRVGHRSELDDLLGEMISELGILHSQVRGSELPVDAEQPVSATLAADFEPVDEGLAVTHILQGDPDLPEERSPLSRPDVDVRLGDVIASVNHRPVRQAMELADALENQAGQPVVIEILRRGEKPRLATVQPVPASELAGRRYRDWEQGKRAEVEQAGDSRIGYLHLYAMGSRDMADFVREFFALQDRDGLIIDVRGNRGGNIDSWVINALTRKVWAFWHTPGSGRAAFENMQGAYRGHVVVLIDEYTYSDGETFAAGIKALDVAPLIGKRTAGAGIWLTGRNPLTDNGIARIAEFPQFGLNGDWLIEGIGVAPDIEVDNLPAASYRGQDAQLQRAISELQDRIAREPIRDLKGRPIPSVGTPGKDVE